MDDTPIFWKVYKALVTLAVIIIIAVVAVLYVALSKYEDRQRALYVKPPKELPIPEAAATPAPSAMPAEVLEAERGVAVLAPDFYKVIINGTVMEEKDIYTKGDLGIKEDYLEYLDNPNDFPGMVVYYVPDMDESVIVEAYDAFGEKVEPDLGAWPYYQYNLREGVISADRAEFYNDLVQKYVKFCMNEGELSDILGYFVSGTDTYNKLGKMDGVKSYSGKHDGLEIGEASFSRYYEYTPNLYHVQIDFVYTVKSGNISRDNPTTLDCYVAKINGNWKIFRMDIS